MNISLSEDDITKNLPFSVPVITYNDLQKCPTIEACWGPNRAVIILYEWKENYGHWVCLFQHKDGTVEFFDPYGFKPDDQKTFIPKDFWEKGYLSYLLWHAHHKRGWPIQYNELPLQQENKNVNTCGRWVLMRLLLRDWPLKKFQKEFFKGDSDKKVVLLTKAIVGK